VDEVPSPSAWSKRKERDPPGRRAFFCPRHEHKRENEKEEEEKVGGKEKNPSPPYLGVSEEGRERTTIGKKKKKREPYSHQSRSIPNSGNKKE